jgi:hypothetical protein
MVSPPRHPRGQQRDKIYREALRLELADMSEGVDLKKLREIARTHIEKAAAGDMQAIKELRDTLDGKPAQVLEHEVPENREIRKIVHEFVHVDAAGKPLPDGEVITIGPGGVQLDMKPADDPEPADEPDDVRHGNGKDGAN